MPTLPLSQALEPTAATTRHFQDGIARARGGAFDLGDVAMAIPRGLEGAVQGIYGVADLMLLDSLPDWEMRFLGSSRTVAGGLVEGVVQFASGFVPAAGLLGRVGAAARLGRIGTAAAAGAIADLTVFTGHEQRLSNLVQEFPSLRNPLTDYLAADPSDSEAEGRLKNVLEGLGVGTLVDAMVLGVRSLRAAQRAQAAGKSEKAIFRAAREATPPEEMADAIEVAGRRPIDPDDPLVVGEPLPPVKDVPREPQRVISDLFLDSEAALLDIDDATKEAVRRGLTEGVNPRKLSASELFERLITRHSLNLERFHSDPQGPLQLMRTFEAFIETFGPRDLPELRPKSLAELQLKIQNDVLDMAHAHETRDALLADWRGNVETQAGLSTRIQAMRIQFLTLAEEAHKSLREFVEAPDDVAPIRFARAQEDLHFLFDTEALVKAIGAEAGRTLRAFQVPIRSMERMLKTEGSAIFKRAVDEETKGLVEQMGGLAHLRKQAKLMLDAYGEGGVSGATALVGAKAGSDPQLGWHLTNSLVLSTWLSGPRTWAVNAVGPLFASVMRTTERVLGGLARGDREAIQSGVRQALGLFTNARASLAIARKDFRTGRQTLLPQNARFELQRAKRLTEARAMLEAERAGTREPTVWHPSSLGVAPDSFAGTMLRGMDYVVGFPQRVMGATDSYVKQLNYRAVVDDILYRRGTDQKLSGAELVEFIESRRERLIAKGQGYTLNLLKREGMESARSRGLTGFKAAEHARDYVLSKKTEIEELLPIADEAIGRGLETSATASLERGTLSHWIQQGTVQHPYLRLVLPFIRTPANLLRYAGQRIDLPSVARWMVGQKFPRLMPLATETKSAFLRDMLSDDPMRKADALGRITMGTGIATIFFGLAAAGTLTGKGPSEPNRARALADAGVLPYSIKIGDTYISYQRIDPYATIMGIAADLMEYAQWADTSQQSNLEMLAASFVTAMLNPLKERSYLRGLANVLDLINDPERRSQRFFEEFIGSLVPPGVSAFTGSFVTVAGDEHMREVRGVLEALRTRVPGLSATLEPRRNVFGEPIERVRSLGAREVGSVLDVFVPIAYAEVSDEIVARELALLRHGFSIPQTTRAGVELIDFRSESGQTAFDRYQELHGVVTVRGRSIKDALRSLVTSRTYQALPQDSDTGLESPRVALVEGVIRVYRDRAFAQMVREYPEVAARAREIGMLRRRRAMGQPTPELEIGVPPLVRGRLPALVSGSATRSKEQF